MFTFSPGIKIYLHTDPVDARKSFDGLFAIVKSDFELDVRNGGLFMFLNRRRNLVKFIHWDIDGLVIFQKRLERGCFQRPLRTTEGKHLLVDSSELQWILTGVDLKSIKKRKRYVVPSHVSACA